MRTYNVSMRLLAVKDGEVILDQYFTKQVQAGTPERALAQVGESLNEIALSVWERSETSLAASEFDVEEVQVLH